MSAPRDNLVRAIFPGVAVRTAGDEMPTLTGHFARFNEWTKIDSAIEGTFMERIAPGAFTKTFAENTPKVLFQHGRDPQIGDKPLGVPSVLREDADGAYYEVPLLDTSYNRDLIPGLKANAYGASFRFSVVKEDWTRNPTRSAWNPDQLPERTVRELRNFEFGPVTFPAYSGATASVRSMTDEYTLDNLTADPTRLRALIEAKQGKALAPEPPDGTPPERAADPSPSAPIADTEARQGPPHVQETTPVDAPEYISREDKASRVTELRASISRRAVEYPGVLPADIEAADVAENREHDELVRDIAAWDARQTRIASFSDDPKKVETSAPVFVRKQSIEDIHDIGKIRSETRSREEYDAKVRENALRSIESQRSPRDLGFVSDIVEKYDVGEDGEGEIARRILLTGSPAYRRYFLKYLRNQQALATPEENRAAALAVTGTTTTGGYAVPYVFDPTMFHTGAWTAENPFRKACRTVTITNGNNWRTVTVGAITAAYGTEASAAIEGGPTFGQPTYTVQTAKAFATLSVETLEDRSDITAELASVFAEGKDTLEENQFAIGAGTTVYPQGMFLDGAYTTKATATNDVTALLDTTAVEGDLPLRYRAKAQWFMNRSTLRQLQILDTSYRYFTGAGIQFPGNPQPNQIGSNGGGNTGLQLLGYPIWEVPSAVSTLTTDASILAVFTDPSSYIIVDRLGMNVEVIPQMLNGATPSFPTLQRGIVVWWRNTARPIAADAGRQLKVQ